MAHMFYVDQIGCVLKGRSATVRSAKRTQAIACDRGLVSPVDWPGAMCVVTGPEDQVTTITSTAGANTASLEIWELSRIFTVPSVGPRLARRVRRRRRHRTDNRPSESIIRNSHLSTINGNIRIHQPTRSGSIPSQPHPSRPNLPSSSQRTLGPRGVGRGKQRGPPVVPASSQSSPLPQVIPASPQSSQLPQSSQRTLGSRGVGWREQQPNAK